MIRNYNLKQQQDQQQESGEGQGTYSIVNLASGAPSESDDMSTSSLKPNGELGPYDVICGRHKAAFNNIGNRRFRVTVSLALDRYISALTRKAKSNMINSIADLVRSNGGRFLQRQDGAWIELNEKHSSQKVGHALRDMAVASAKKISRSRASTAAVARKSAFQPTKTMAHQVSSGSAPWQDTHVTKTSFEDTIATATCIEPQGDVKARRESVDSYILAWLVDVGDFILDTAVSRSH